VVLCLIKSRKTLTLIQEKVNEISSVVMAWNLFSLAQQLFISEGVLLRGSVLLISDMDLDQICGEDGIAWNWLMIVRAFILVVPKFREFSLQFCLLKCILGKYLVRMEVEKTGSA